MPREAEVSHNGFP